MNTGGSLIPRNSEYYWRGQDGVLYHTSVSRDGVEAADPFFDSIDDADRYLEQLADQNGDEPYKGLVLKETGDKKVKEAVEVLMDQSGLEDFL